MTKKINFFKKSKKSSKVTKSWNFEEIVKILKFLAPKNQKVQILCFGPPGGGSKFGPVPPEIPRTFACRTWSRFDTPIGQICPWEGGFVWCFAGDFACKLKKKHRGKCLDRISRKLTKSPVSPTCPVAGYGARFRRFLDHFFGPTWTIFLAKLDHNFVTFFTVFDLIK